MPLMKLSEYRVSSFTSKSRPSIPTIKKWINNGDIVGMIIGGLYFVDVGKVAPVNNLVNKVLVP